MGTLSTSSLKVERNSQNRAPNWEIQKVSVLAKSIACCSEGVEGQGFRGGWVGVGRWALLLPIGFITTDRSLLSGGDCVSML